MLIKAGERVLNSQYCMPTSDLVSGDLARIQSDLTYVLEKDYDPKGGKTVFQTYELENGVLKMPRHYGLSNFGKPTRLDTILPVGAPYVPFPIWTPRTGQEDAVVDTTAKLLTRTGGCLQMFAGGGKTVSSLQIAHRMQVPVLVLVHQQFLMDQWQERIEEFCGITPGIIRQDTCEWYDRPISIGMIQSLIGERTYDPGMYNWWGMIIIDEVHHMGASQFNRAIDRFPAHYRLGLTATPKRKDGMSEVFFRSIGPILHTAKVKRVKGNAYQLFTRIKVNDKAYRMRSPKGSKRARVNTAKMITNLSKNKERNEQILDNLVKGYNKGRKIIALSHRREHLNYLEAEMHKRGCKDTGQYVGQSAGASKKSQDKAKAALEKASKAQLIFATYQMAAEGLDIKELDCAHLLTPISDCEQAVGRIQRELEGKPTPVVIHYVDLGSKVLTGMANSVKRVLKRVGFSIKT